MITNGARGTITNMELYFWWGNAFASSKLVRMNELGRTKQGRRKGEGKKDLSSNPSFKLKLNESSDFYCKKG